MTFDRGEENTSDVSMNTVGEWKGRKLAIRALLYEPLTCFVMVNPVECEKDGDESSVIKIKVGERIVLNKLYNLNYCKEHLIVLNPACSEEHGKICGGFQITFSKPGGGVVPESIYYAGACALAACGYRSDFS